MKCFSSLIVAVALSTPVHAFAQGAHLGYVFGGANAAMESCRCSGGAMQLGGGGEFMLSKNVGVGGDVSLLVFDRSGYGLLSVNGSYHFATKGSTHMRPFVTAGLVANDGAVVAGGGIDRWVKPRVGFRLEVRDQFRPGSANMLGARFGVVIR